MPQTATRRAWAVVAALGGLALGAGGCGGGNVMRLSGEADFTSKVLAAEKPVVVEFYKRGCATCGLLEPTLDDLAGEYDGRVRFASFEMMTPVFQVTSPELRERYRIAFYPTVLLFVDGAEHKRWVMEFDKSKYVQVLDEVAGPAAAAGPGP